MMRPQTTPKAALAMGANRANERNAKDMAELKELCRLGAQRIVELTDLVADLQERVAVLEGGRG